MKRDDDIRGVMDSFRRIVRALRLSDRHTDRQLGIGVAQLFVLQQLADGQARSMSQLAEGTHTDPSSVSVVVRRLIGRGLVGRRAPAKDSRRAEISLTAEGREVLRRAPPSPQQLLVAALEALPATRRRELADTLARVVATLGDIAPTFFFEDE